MPQIIQPPPVSAGALMLRESQIASGSSALNFTSWKSADYDTYEFHFLGIIPTTSGARLHMRFSTDGGQNYDSGSNYAHNTIGWSLSGSSFFGSYSDTSFDVFDTTLYNTSPQSGQAIYKIHFGTGLWPTMTALSSRPTAGDQPTHPAEGSLTTAVYKSATAVNAFRVFPSAGNFAGTIRVYGYVKA